MFGEEGGEEWGWGLALEGPERRKTESYFVGIGVRDWRR